MRRGPLEEPGEKEALEQVSADLPFELQSKMFDQLAAMGLAGAGLTITLVGSILQGARMIWLAAIEFGLAAIVALVAQQYLIDALLRRTAVRRRSRNASLIALILLGMGVGSLGTSVLLEGGQSSRAEKNAE